MIVDYGHIIYFFKQVMVPVFKEFLYNYDLFLSLNLSY